METEAFAISRPYADCRNENGRPKRWWSTQGRAHAAAIRISKGNMDGRVRPYLCPSCGHWHVGHAKKVEGGQLVSTKGEILKVVAEIGEAMDAIDLVDRLKRRDIQTNQQTVTALVWDLQKEQLVTFIERGSGVKTPMHIRLTDRGRKIAGAAEPKEEPTVATYADRIHETMLTAGPQRTWSPRDLSEALGLDVKYPVGTVRTSVNNDARFWKTPEGSWTLKIWRSLHEQRGTVELPTPLRDTQPVTVPEQAPTNGHHEPKPVEAYPLTGLELIAALVDRAEKRDQLAAAARMLEAAGEEELALQTLARVELTALEEEVVRLVRRIRGLGDDAPHPAHAGVEG